MSLVNQVQTIHWFSEYLDWTRYTYCCTCSDILLLSRLQCLHEINKALDSETGIMDIVPTARARNSDRERDRSERTVWADNSRADYTQPEGGLTDAQALTLQKFQHIYLPMTERKLLFEYVHQEWRQDPNYLTKEPCLSTFYHILQQPFVKKRLKFMKKVILGRCPVCQYFKSLIARSFGDTRVSWPADAAAELLS